MRLSATSTVRSGIPSEDEGAIRRQGYRPQKSFYPPEASLLRPQMQRHFGDVALCVRIPRSGRFEALSSPSGRLKRTLRGRSVMRPAAGHLALRPQSVRDAPRGPKNLTPSETRTDKATSPKRPRSVRPGPAAGHPPQMQKGPPPGDAGDGLGKGGRRPGEAAAPREGARPGRPAPNRDGARAGRAARSPRSARGRAPRPAGG